jgi:hypothetical protein
METLYYSEFLTEPDFEPINGRVARCAHFGQRSSGGTNHLDRNFRPQSDVGLITTKYVLEVFMQVISCF